MVFVFVTLSKRPLIATGASRRSCRRGTMQVSTVILEGVIDVVVPVRSTTSISGMVIFIPVQQRVVVL